MLGENTFKRAIINVTEEGAKQYALVQEEVQKLSDITGKPWGFMTKDLFDKVRTVSYFEGAAIFAISYIVSYTVLSYIERRRAKKQIESMEQKSKGKGQ